MDYFLLRKLALDELNNSWKKVLSYDDCILNSCEVPQELSDMFFEQVAIHIYPYYIEFLRNYYPERSYLISPKLDKLCRKIKEGDCIMKRIEEEKSNG